MKYDLLYNFISPVTGKIKIDSGYTLIGDKYGISLPSPILIDIRQDIIDLRRKIGGFEELNKLDHNRIWIGDYNNQPVEQLHIGVINLPPLVEAVFPNPISPITGDFRIPNPTFDYLSPFDWVMSGPFLPQIYATKYDTLGNPVGTDVSSSLAMTQVRAAQIMKRFDNANFIVGSSTVDFDWENPKMYLIPEPLKQLYGLGTSYTFTKAQSLGALETGLLKNTVNNGSGTLSKAISGEDYVNTADIPIGNLVILDPLYPLAGHKLIAPTAFNIRKNNPGEFGYPIGGIIPILIGVAGEFENLAIGGLTPGDLIKANESGEIKPAIPNVDYTTPSVISTILGIISAFQAAYNIFVAATTAKDAVQDVEITAIQAKDVTQDVSIGAAQATADGAMAQALAAPAEGAAIAAAYFTEQMLPYSLIPIVPAGISISGAIGVVAVAAAAAQSSADTANNRIDNLTVNLIGDVIGTNNISDPIVTVFTPNPRFTGKEYIKIPVGNIAERPSNPEVGMIRYNLEI